MVNHNSNLPNIITVFKTDNGKELSFILCALYRNKFSLIASHVHHKYTCNYIYKKQN